MVTEYLSMLFIFSDLCKGGFSFRILLNTSISDVYLTSTTEGNMIHFCKFDFWRPIKTVNNLRMKAETNGLKSFLIQVIQLLRIGNIFQIITVFSWLTYSWLLLAISNIAEQIASYGQVIHLFIGILGLSVCGICSTVQCVFSQ